MSDIFGISFSNRALHIAHVSQANVESELLSVNTFPYPFTFNFDTLFEEENLDKLSEILLTEKREKQIEKLEYYVSLPLNFAFIKKIAVPIDAAADISYSQIQWELENYLPDELAKYKVIKTDTEYFFNSYKEVIVIAINRSIIEKLCRFATQSEASLQNLVLDNYSVENFLKANGYFEESANQVVFKIDKFIINTHIFINGAYYTSFLDSLKSPSKNSSCEEKILEITKDRYNQSRNILNQLPFIKQDLIRLFIYGDKMNENILKLVRSEFTDKTEDLPLNNYPGIVDKDNAYIEALGVVLENTRK